MPLLSVLKSAFGRGASKREDGLAAWAQDNGFEIGTLEQDHVSISARSPAWRVSTQKSARNYIQGSEVISSCHLGLSSSPTVVLIDRALKDWLERQAYAGVTDGVHTGLHDSVPQEVLWLASCEEVGWNGPSDQFWSIKPL